MSQSIWLANMNNNHFSFVTFFQGSSNALKYVHIFGSKPIFPVNLLNLIIVLHSKFSL